MARRFLVMTEFKAVDGMSPAMTKMNRGFSRFAMQITDQSSVIGKSFAGANRMINQGLMIGLGALAVGAGIAVNEFIKLDKAVTNAGAKFVDVDSRDLKSFNESLTLLKQSARAVGAETEFSSVDAAGALEKFAMAGFSSVQSMALLRGTTDLATAADTDLTTAVDIATDSLGAFNLAVDDAGQLQKNLSRISDVMARTTVTANTNLTDLFEAVKMGAPAFTAAGQDVETFSAMAGVLANAGIKGGEAGTALRNVMLRLAAPTGEAAAILEHLGIQTQDAQGNFLDAVDIVGQFQRATEGMGTAQKSAVLSTIFGNRAVTSFNLLLNEGAESLGRYRQDLYDSAGAAATMAGAIRGGLANQIEILKSSAIELGLKFVEAFEGQGREALAKLIETVQNFDVGPLVAFGKAVVAVLGFLIDNWKTIFSIAVAIKAVSLALGVLTVATQVFGVTLAATPIGWIIAAVAALAFGVAMLITHWDSVTAALARFGAFVTDTILPIFKTIGQVLLKYMLTPVNLLIDGILFILELASKIPGVGDKFGDMADSIRSMKDRVNTSITGTAGTFDYGGIINPESGNVQTPTPHTGGMPSQYSRVDLNFNNAPENMAVKNAKLAAGVKMNFTPALN